MIAALTSDVPVGVFLSGGLDSTAITALARPHVHELATFALGFDVPGFDERDHAALAARTLRTRHRTLTIDPSLFQEGVQAMAAVLDEPLADPALVPTFLLARLARSEVKVVLIGEGGDELFAGYPTYLGGALGTAFQRLPLPVRRALAGAAPALGAPRGNTTARWMLRRFLEAADRPEAQRHREWTGCMSSARLAQLATPGGPLTSPDGASDEPWVEHGLPGRTTIDRLLALDLTGLLPDTLLRKADRATMAASLEGRAPFLDHHVVELACRLPVGAEGPGARHQARAAPGRGRHRAAADPAPGEARAHGAARHLDRRPARAVRARHARPPRSRHRPARRGTRPAGRARGAPARQPARAVGAGDAAALAGPAVIPLPPPADCAMMFGMHGAARARAITGLRHRLRQAER